MKQACVQHSTIRCRFRISHLHYFPNFCQSRKQNSANYGNEILPITEIETILFVIISHLSKIGNVNKINALSRQPATMPSAGKMTLSFALSDVSATNPLAARSLCPEPPYRAAHKPQRCAAPTDDAQYPSCRTLSGLFREHLLTLSEP